jgi:hypothetical protein
VKCLISKKNHFYGQFFGKKTKKSKKIQIWRQRLGNFLNFRCIGGGGSETFKIFVASAAAAVFFWGQSAAAAAAQPIGLYL